MATMQTGINAKLGAVEAQMANLVQQVSRSSSHANTNLNQAPKIPGPVGKPLAVTANAVMSGHSVEHRGTMVWWGSPEGRTCK